MNGDRETWGAVLLAGGQGKRLGGISKAELSLGGEPFYRRLLPELEKMGGPVYYSSGAFPAPEGLEIPEIPDLPRFRKKASAGPLGGLISCFHRTDCSLLLFVACDMPFFRKEMGTGLLSRWTGEEDALIWRTRDGRMQPLCGLYSRRCLPVMEECARAGELCLRSFLGRIRCRTVDTEEAGIPDFWFSNVNSPEGAKAAAERRPAVLAVSGIKNSGKTTLLEKLVHSLSASGIRVAVIKHDGHDFEADVPGTDSRRMQEAGAFGTVVYSPHRYMAVKTGEGFSAEDFFGLFPEADLILLEGQKHSSWKKLELVRQACGCGPVCDPRSVAAYVTDLTDGTGRPGFPQKWRREGMEDCPVFAFDDLASMVRLIISHMDRA